VQLPVGDGPLGFSIRGGAEYNLAHFISEVHTDSVAQRAGLQAGDQVSAPPPLPPVRRCNAASHRPLWPRPPTMVPTRSPYTQILAVNEVELGTLSHTSAVRLLKSCQGSIALRVVYTGKIPTHHIQHQALHWAPADSTTDDAPLEASLLDEVRAPSTAAAPSARLASADAPLALRDSTDWAGPTGARGARAARADCGDSAAAPAGCESNGPHELPHELPHGFGFAPPWLPSR
jgi:hypothetical protein